MPEPARSPRPPEEVVCLRDFDAALDGVIVLHSTALGPAAGGCRLWHYPSRAEAAADAVRLAEGMSYKNALAGLPFGGGKAVLRASADGFDRAALFRAFGRAVADLRGRYVTAEDVGTSVADMQLVAGETRHVAGLPAAPGRSGGDPSPWTALGVFRAMEVAVGRRLGTDLRGVRVGVQGLGNVGFALCGLLHEAGARLVVAEPRSAVVAQAAVRFGAEVATSAAMLAADIDVFAPCALGGVIDARTARQLRASVICGAANNQLATPEDGDTLAARGILYAPDYVVNAGGIINVAAEHLGWSPTTARDRIDRIGARLGEVLDLADMEGVAPHAAADRLAQAMIGGKGRAALAA